MTESEREAAVRAAIKAQAPDLKVKYVFSFDYGHLIGANFDLPSKHAGGLPVLKGFSTTGQTLFNQKPIDAGVIAAQLIAGCRYWYEHIHPLVQPYTPGVAA